MGRTKNETDEVQTSAHDVSNVKVSDLRKFYEQGHSPAEVADEFEVEEADVIAALKLNDEPNNEWNEPRSNEWNEPRSKPAASAPADDQPSE